MTDSIFNAQFYKELDIARFNHFDTLGVDFKNKTILELGAGIGNHTEFILSKSPKKVYVIEGRGENIEILQQRFAKTKKVISWVGNLENGIEDFSLPVDWIYNYGLLYHLSKPFDFLDSLKKFPHKNMVIETCIAHSGDVNNTFEGECPTQSLVHLGSRPNKDLLIEKLKEIYEEVVVPTNVPKHEQFNIYGTAPLIRIVAVCKNRK